MTVQSTDEYHLGDMLALARQSWVRQLTVALAATGYPDYRRSDALAMRLLRRGALPIGRLGDALAVTRQAARKVAAALEDRGYAVVQRDTHDARQFNVALTSRGHDYASAIIDAIGRLDDRVAAQLTPAQLAAADTVLRAVIADEHTRGLAAHVQPPDGTTEG